MKKLGLVLKSLIFSLFLISAPFVFAEEKASALPENSTAVAENDSSAEKTEPKEDVKPEEESELKKNKKQLKKDKNEKDTQKEEEKENKTVINIENARNTKYEKDKETGNLPYGYFEYSNEILYSPSSDTYQLRLTQTMNEKLIPQVKWYLDGVETTKEALIEMNALGSKQRQTKPFNPKEDPVFNVKLENIIEIK